MYFRYAIFRALFITLTDFVRSTSTNTVWYACEKTKKKQENIDDVRGFIMLKKKTGNEKNL